MTRSCLKGPGIVVTAFLATGCTTMPETITVPNPLAAFNGLLPASRVAGASSHGSVPAGEYQAAPATYVARTPQYDAVPVSRYGIAPPVYAAVPSEYSVAAPTPPASAPVVEDDLYTLESAPVAVETYAFETLESSDGQAPAYVAVAPEIEDYVVPSYGADSLVLGTPASVAPVETVSVPTFGVLEPVEASGTTYDLTAPPPAFMIEPVASVVVDDVSNDIVTVPLDAPAIPLAIDSYEMFPRPGMSLGGGVATYGAPLDAPPPL